MTAAVREPLLGPRGRLLLAVGCWLLFAALTVGLGFSLREGGVLADGTDLQAFLDTSQLLRAAGLLAAAFLVTHFALRWLAPGADPLLLPVVAALCSVGWVFLAALGPDLAAHKGKPGLASMATNHQGWIALGLLTCVAVAAVSQRGALQRLGRLKYLMAGAYLALVAATALFGAPRELGAIVLTVAGQDIQTIEIAKYLFMFFAAGYLAEEAEWLRSGDRIRWSLILPWLVVATVGLLPLVYPLKEVGPTILVGLAFLTLLYVYAGSRSLRLVAGLGLGTASLGGLAYLSGVPGVVRQRWDAFVEPFAHSSQTAHGLWALAEGGMTGTGLTASSAYHVPIVESDYALAGWVEMTGLAGGALVLALYGLLLWRGLDTARRARDPFEGALALGLTAVLGSQVVMIVAGTLAFAPLTGITLPFISHGGISLVTNFVAVGALLSISTRLEPVPEPTRSAPLRRVGLAGALVLGCLFVGLWWRSVGSSEAGSAQDFVGSSRQERLADAVAAGAVVRSPSGELALDPEVAGGLRRSTRRDLTRQLAAGTLVEGDDGIEVLSSCCTVRNPRTSGLAPSVLRGRIFDVQGRALAHSVPVPGKRARARVYPYGAALFDVTGLHHPHLASASGAEAHFDDLLRGEGPRLPRRGLRRLVARRDAGDDVQLTVDAGVSQQAWAMLGPQGTRRGLTRTGRGAVVVLEARSGNILAAVSRPAADPNTWAVTVEPDGTPRWASTADPGAWERMGYELRDHPRTSRALSTRFPPGSTFKLLVGAAWLEAGGSSEHIVDCPARHPESEYLPSCHHHPRQPKPDLPGALAESCNSWFGRAGVDLGDRVLPFARALGFGRGWDLAQGVPGREWTTLPSRAWERPGQSGKTVPWDAGWFQHNPKSTARSAIGQDTVEATPLQMALLASTIANGGELVPPRLVAALRVAPDPSRADERLGPAWLRPARGERVRVFGRDSAELITEGMVAAFEEGTASSLPVIVRSSDGHHRLVERDAVGRGADLVPVAVKTGTADVCTGCSILPHSWMVAWAPADASPSQAKIVVAAIVENGRSGAGDVALRSLTSGLNTLEGRGPDPVEVDLARRAPLALATAGETP